MDFLRLEFLRLAGKGKASDEPLFKVLLLQFLRGDQSMTPEDKLKLTALLTGHESKEQEMESLFSKKETASESAEKNDIDKPIKKELDLDSIVKRLRAKR